MESCRLVPVGSLNPSAWDRITLALVLTLFISCSPHKFLCYFFTFCYLYVPLIVTKAQAQSIISMMEVKAAELVAALKNSNMSVDTKVAHLQCVKSDIKQKNVPEGAVPSIFESIRLAIASQHSSLSGAGFSTLGHFLKRLLIQELHHLVALQCRALYPLLVERLGDHKERIRAQAAQSFTDMWLAAPEEVEQCVLGQALVGKNPRAKEMSMIWLSNMTKNYGLLFRSYVSSLVACLEDADSNVRNTAKNTVIELFENASERAKSDLKRQMATHNVRKSFVNAILASIDHGTSDMDAASRPISRAEALVHHPVSRAETQASRSVSRLDTHQRPASRMELAQSSILHTEALPPRPVSVLSSRSETHKEVTKEVIGVERPKSRLTTAKSEPNWAVVSHTGPAEELPLPSSRPASQEGEKIDALYVSSSRQVDELFRDMMPHFEGRESEDNWIRREKDVLTLRRLTHGNAPDDYSPAYLAGLKTLLDGIFKVVNSLRTTLSTIGCLLIQDIAKRCGPRIDSMVEIMMQNLIKLCSGMKKISAQNGNATVDALIENVTFTTRILQHVSGACQDKNVQLRLFAAGWLKTLIQKQSHHKSSIEHGGGLDMMEKSVKKCLADANPGVREAMRSTFWTYYRVWPNRANEILSNLDPKSRSLLEKDPANPNAHQSAPKDSGPSRKGLANGTSSLAGRSALKEAIAAQKKARLAPAKAVPPPRPESAQSALSDKHSSAPSSSKSSVRTVPTGTSLSSLSSAPVRPAAKPRRPELNRPATADPYAARRSVATDSSTRHGNQIDGSPSAAKSKSSTPSLKSVSSTGSRDRADPVGTTRDRPKRLVISKTRSHDTHTRQHSKPIPTHSRKNSNESIPRHSPLRSEFSVTPISPNSVSLETPSTPRSHLVQDHGNLIAIASPPTHIQRTPIEPDASAEDPREHAAKATPVAIFEDTTPARSDHDDIQDAAMTLTENQTPQPSKVHSDSPIVSNKRVSNQDESVPHLTTGLGFLTGVGSVVEASELPNSDAQTDQSRFADHSLPVTHQPDSVTDSSKPSGLSSSLMVAGSPIRVANNENEIVIDSKTTHVSLPHRSSPKHNVLGELTSNEPSQRANKQIRHAANKLEDEVTTPIDDHSRHRWKKVEIADRRTSISPRSKDPTKAQQMLDKGIQRIRTKTMDILGYRKLQGIIKYHDSIFTNEEKYDEMLLALLDELESSPDDKRQPLGRPLDLKTQVLLTIRLMLIHNKIYFSAYCSRALGALVLARKYYDANCHIVSGLEETADDIIALCEPAAVIDSVLDVIITEEKDDREYRSILMGVSVLTRILSRLNAHKCRVPELPLDRLGQFAASKLADRQPDVRRLAVQLCVQLHGMVANEEEYWRVLGHPRENSRNLLTYYILKK
ncbi:suppressor of tub2 mutation [Aspergillus fumigatus]|nr:suppressor of tub2 mutation [Aspergillus fumigatus]KAH2609809.1 suppressor of tub2 mutation [Aspergillus fumigatus]KAH2642073.1 suppressor of tub2 mutation [Aspergillus fumigatus]